MDGENNGKVNGWFGSTHIFGNIHIPKIKYHILNLVEPQGVGSTPESYLSILPAFEQWQKLQIRGTANEGFTYQTLNVWYISLQGGKCR